MLGWNSRASRTWKDEQKSILRTLDKALLDAPKLDTDTSGRMQAYFKDVIEIIRETFGQRSPWLPKFFAINWTGVPNPAFALFLTPEGLERNWGEARDACVKLMAALRTEVELLDGYPLKVEKPPKGPRVALIQTGDKAVNAQAKDLFSYLDLKSSPVAWPTSPAKPTLDALERMPKNVGYAVVLPPAGDGLSSDYSRWHFRLGYVFGRLGSELVAVLKRPGGDFSDFPQVRQIDFQGPPGSWQAQVARELKNAGYFVEERAIREIEASGVPKPAKKAKKGQAAKDAEEDQEPESDD
jgi:hypothetical protein